MRTSKRSILFNYVLSASIIMLTLVIVAWYSSDRFHNFFIEQLKTSLTSRAITVALDINTEEIRADYCQTLSVSDPTTRVTIVSLSGKVLCDSQANLATMDNHLSRPEIKQAILSSSGSIIRFSQTVQYSLLYVAIRYKRDQQDIIIRVSIPLVEIETLLGELYSQFYLLMLLLMIITALMLWSIYNKINKPLAQIIQSARLISKGKFDTKIPEYEIKEIAQLGKALNEMTEHLGRLENLRQEFVANVSHELKTPITTIQSYVETLLDGAMHEQKDMQRFLTIVLKQNNRLAHIVDDLLMLSRLENAPINEVLERHNVDVLGLLQAAKELCLDRADKKNIKIKIICDKTLSLKADQSLMTQAIVNLLDNAIKYSDEKTQIDLIVEHVDEDIKIIVSDQGPGISDYHFHRLFERFYRTDKSRSRREGGTGLGLAIVKHIIQIHGAEIKVENNKDKGCRFIIAFQKHKA